MTVGSKLGMLPAESKIDHSSLNYAHGDFSKFEILLGGTIRNLDRTFKSDVEKLWKLDEKDSIFSSCSAPFVNHVVL